MSASTRGSVNQALFHYPMEWPAHCQNPGNRPNHPVHPLQIQLAAFLGEVALHLAPLRPRTHTGGRILKSPFERVVCLLSQGKRLEGAYAGEAPLFATEYRGEAC